jgi:hypothetical protein
VVVWRFHEKKNEDGAMAPLGVALDVLVYLVVWTAVIPPSTDLFIVAVLQMSTSFRSSSSSNFISSAKSLFRIGIRKIISVFLCPCSCKVVGSLKSFGTFYCVVTIRPGPFSLSGLDFRQHG